MTIVTTNDERPKGRDSRPDDILRISREVFAEAKRILRGDQIFGDWLFWLCSPLGQCFGM